MDPRMQMAPVGPAGQVPPHSGPTPPHMTPMARSQSTGSGPPPNQPGLPPMQQGLPPMQPGGLQQIPQHMGGGYVGPPQGQGYDEWNHEWQMMNHHLHGHPQQGPPPPVSGPPPHGHPAHHMMHHNCPPHGPPQHMHGHPGMQPQVGYPHPQQPSVVFNQNNPNAPPIFLCGQCSKEVTENDQPIQCEAGCKFWFHRVCSGLTIEAFHLLRHDCFAEWICNLCAQKIPQIPYIKIKS